MKTPSEEIEAHATNGHSTADKRLLLMVNLIVSVTALLTVCEIFSRIAVENRHFRPLVLNIRLRDP